MKFNDTYRRSSPVFPQTPGWRLGRNRKSPTGTPLGVTASKSVPCPWTRGEGHGRSVKHEKHDKFKGSTEKTVFERFYRIQLIWSIVINSSTRTAFTLMLSFRSSITKPPSPSNSSNVVSLMWMRLAEEVQKYIFTYKLLNLNLLQSCCISSQPWGYLFRATPSWTQCWQFPQTDNTWASWTPRLQLPRGLKYKRQSRHLSSLYRHRYITTYMYKLWAYCF